MEEQEKEQKKLNYAGQLYNKVFEAMYAVGSTKEYAMRVNGECTTLSLRDRIRDQPIFTIEFDEEGVDILNIVLYSGESRGLLKRIFGMVVEMYQEQ